VAGADGKVPPDGVRCAAPSCQAPARFLFVVGDEDPLPRCEMHAEETRIGLNRLVRPNTWYERAAGDGDTAIADTPPTCEAEWLWTPICENAATVTLRLTKPFAMRLAAYSKAVSVLHFCDDHANSAEIELRAAGHEPRRG
jgi:hypothetical protein